MSVLRAHLFEMAIKVGIDKTLEVATHWHGTLMEVNSACGTDVSYGGHALRRKAEEIQGSIDRLQELKQEKNV
jgi:hypothetical protein